MPLSFITFSLNSLAAAASKRKSISTLVISLSKFITSTNLSLFVFAKILSTKYARNISASSSALPTLLEVNNNSTTDTMGFNASATKEQFAVVDENGCSDDQLTLDDDNDGVPNISDQCPNTDMNLVVGNLTQGFS